MGSLTHAISPAAGAEYSIPDLTNKLDEVERRNRQETIISSIRVTHPAAGLNRIPAGFYAAVRHGDLEWRTPNKPMSGSEDGVIEWRAPIPIPSDLTSTIHIAIVASFEFQPILGRGEVLWELTITVQQLLDKNAKGLAFNFYSMSGHIKSTRPSLLVTVQLQRQSGKVTVLEPHCSIVEPLGQLEEKTNLGHMTLSRYKQHGDIRDLERSIENFEHALNHCPFDHPCRAAAQSNLAFSKFTRCEAGDSDLSLGVPIGLYRDALKARPTGHPDRSSTLIELAGVHFARFRKQTDVLDGAMAVTFMREAMTLGSIESYQNQVAISAVRLHAAQAVDHFQAGHYSTTRDSSSGLMDKNAWILNLSALLLHHYQRLGDQADLQQAILVMQTSISDEDRPYAPLLENLGLALWYRFGHLGRLDDIEKAIEIQSDAVGSTPDAHPNKPHRLNHLGNSFLARFESLGRLPDLDEAISLHRDAVALTPEDHAGKLSHVANLATILMTRFMHLNDLGDLEEAIALYKKAIELTPDMNHNKSGCFDNLATALRSRFKYQRARKDIEEAIDLHQKAIDAVAGRSRNECAYLNNLAASVFTRFVHFGEERDLEEAVSLYSQAMKLAPATHPKKPKYMNDLANSFRTRFEHLGNLNDLEDAISLHQQAMKPDGGSNHRTHVYLNSLATSLLARFKHVGNPDDLEESISKHKGAIQLLSHGYYHKPVYLNDLSAALLVRFEYHGESGDLKDAISNLQDVVALVPEGHPEKPEYTKNLAVCFRTRFTHFGQPNDLGEAISAHKKAVELAATYGRDKSDDVKTRVTPRHTSIDHVPQSDLERAISLHEEVVKLTPDGHLQKWRRLDSLANSLLMRFEHFGAKEDLEEANRIHEDAVRLRGAASAATSSVCFP